MHECSMARLTIAGLDYVFNHNGGPKIIVFVMGQSIRRTECFLPALLAETIEFRVKNVRGKNNIHNHLWY